MKKLYFIAVLLVFALLNSSFTSQSANEKLIRTYYHAYEQKDWNSLKTILSPGFKFCSPNDDHISLDTYHTRCWPNSRNTKRFDLEKVILGSDDAFVTYNGYTNDGKVFRNTEYFKFKNGKITENDCYFGPGISYPDNKRK